MKKRNFGFTLIELLVVIVIIGILATISTATFKSYFGKARDAERQSGVQNIALMIKVDGADDWTNTKYAYDDAGLTALMAANDFRIPDGKNDICYFIGMSDGSATGVGDDNEFVVATWGESTSTELTGTSGLLMDGTAAAMDSLLDIGTALIVGDFSCAADMANNIAAFTDATTGVAGTATYLYVDADGEIVDDMTP